MHAAYRANKVKCIFAACTHFTCGAENNKVKGQYPENTCKINMLKKQMKIKLNEIQLNEIFYAFAVCYDCQRLLAAFVCRHRQADTFTHKLLFAVVFLCAIFAHNNHKLKL